MRKTQAWFFCLVSMILMTTTMTQESEKPPCEDETSSCDEFKDMCKDKIFRDSMKEMCRKTCGFCGDDEKTEPDSKPQTNDEKQKTEGKSTKSRRKYEEQVRKTGSKGPERVVQYHSEKENRNDVKETRADVGPSNPSDKYESKRREFPSEKPFAENRKLSEEKQRENYPENDYKDYKRERDNSGHRHTERSERNYRRTFKDRYEGRDKDVMQDKPSERYEPPQDRYHMKKSSYMRLFERLPPDAPRRKYRIRYGRKRLHSLPNEKDPHGPPNEKYHDKADKKMNRISYRERQPSEPTRISYHSRNEERMYRRGSERTQSPQRLRKSHEDDIRRKQDVKEFSESHHRYPPKRTRPIRKRIEFDPQLPNSPHLRRSYPCERERPKKKLEEQATHGERGRYFERGDRKNEKEFRHQDHARERYMKHNLRMRNGEGMEHESPMPPDFPVRRDYEPSPYRAKAFKRRYRGFKKPDYDEKLTRETENRVSLNKYQKYDAERDQEKGMDSYRNDFPRRRKYPESEQEPPEITKRDAKRSRGTINEVSPRDIAEKEYTRGKDGPDDSPGPYDIPVYEKRSNSRRTPARSIEKRSEPFI